MADFTHDAEVQARARETEGGAVEGEVVEEAVGGGVGGLAAVADHAADGGKGDEEVEGIALRKEGGVQIPGAAILGADDRVPVGEVEVFKENVL